LRVNDLWLTGLARQLLGSASHVFVERKAKPSVQEQRHEIEVQRFKSVIAETTGENLELKKRLSGERTTSSSRPSFRSGRTKRSSRPSGVAAGS
jgi:hypothetical protein